MRASISGIAALFLSAAAISQTTPVPLPDASIQQSSAPGPLTNPDTRPAPVPLQETIFGRELADPYRWMESPDRRAEVQAFIRESSAHARAQLAALPGWARLRDRIAAGFNVGIRYGDAVQGGENIFYQRTDPDAQLPKLVVRSAQGVERVLYDPEAEATRGAVIHSYSVSPDGRTLAINVGPGGDEIGEIRFIDVASADILPDRLQPVWSEFEAVWFDNRLIAYTRMTSDANAADRLQNMRVYLHRLGEQRVDGPALLGAGVEGAAVAPAEFPVIRLPETGPWAIGMTVGARADIRLFVTRRADLAAGRPVWRAISGGGDRIGYEDRLNDAQLIGDTLYLLTTKEAPNGEVRALDLARDQVLGDARVVIPASDLIVESITAGDDGLYVLGQTDGISRLLFLPLGADRPVEVALPLQGNVTSIESAGPDRGVIFGMQDWFTAPRWFRAYAREVTPLQLDSASYSGIQGARQIRETAISADGTRVPLIILVPPGDHRGPFPTVLEGYGSYGFNLVTPRYRQSAFGLLESGGIIAYCGTRGGGERGRAWHEGGRSANKPNAHADLIACAERLVTLRLTTPDRLTVLGTSAGGLLVPPAALRRPDLFGAMITNVAMLNPVRIAHEENGANQFSEMGDPGTEAGFNALLAQDSYHILPGARDMPDTLVVVGLNDRRLSPWLMAKFAARALERFGSRSLVLFRADPEAGHGFATPRAQMIEQYADMYAFVLSQAGMEGFGAPPSR